MPVFLDARRRIYRARAHRDEFPKQWSEFLDEDPYSPAVHVEDNGEGSIYATARYEEMRQIFSRLFGEMLYHLRAALDTCVHTAAVLDSGQNPPPNEQALALPVCRSTKA